MQTYKLNGVEEGIKKVIESQGFAWQQNEMKQSQQQSPSFQQTFNRSQSQQDHNLKIDIQVDDKQIQLENNRNEEARQEEGEYKRHNKSLFQTLNNSIDKLFCNDNFSTGQDIYKYVIFKDFQSDSKLNSKYGSKRESKQQTPKCTPRFNFQGQDCQNLQQQVAQFLEKPNRNNSNYQSQESFCFKEGMSIESIIPNSQTCASNINQVIFQNNLYSSYSQQNNGINYKVESENLGYNEYSPYLIYQQNNTNETENQQQLNSYHLPQKKKKIITNSALNSTNIKQNNNFYHQINSDFQSNPNKQASMMIMMSQVYTHQQQKRLNKQQTAKNKESQINYNQNLGRVCQTEPSYDDFQEESEMMNSYKSGHINQESGIKFYQQNEKIIGKPLFIKNDNQPSFLNNTNNTREFRNIQLTKRPINDIKNSKQVTGDERNQDYDQMKEDYFNEEDLYEVDQSRQNIIEDLVKFQQNSQQFANNLKHNNFLNQKLYQNQISRVKQQVLIQQQNTAKNIQKINISDQKQADFQNRAIKRNNTNPTGIAPSQQNPIRIGSGDSRKANQMSMTKSNQLFGDQNKIFLNGKINTATNDTTNFNHIQRKVRQFSTHANSSNSNQFLTDKNNHLIDEDYNSNNQSFVNLNNIPFYTDAPQDEQGKQQSQKNGFSQQSQQNRNKQEQQIQNIAQQQNLIKKQLNFQSYQEDQIQLNIEKQIINKKIQDFEKKRNINLNNQQQSQQQQQQVASSSSQSSANSSKLANQQQNLMINTSSSAQAVNQNSVYTVQQPKRNQSAQKKKKSKSKSPAQKGLDSILEVSQKLEVSDLLNTQAIKQSQEKSKQLTNEQKKQSQGKELNSSNLVDLSNQNENQQESLKKGDIQQIDQSKVICKTEGNESDSSLKINFDESDANQLTKIDQDQQLLSTNQSSTYKITNQENALNYIRSVNSKQFQKNHKRVQSANKNSSSSNQNSFLMHPQLTLTINNNQTLQNVPSNQYFLQTQSNMHRGRFNSYQNSNQNPLNLQQFQKKLNIQCQTTTNNTSGSQQNSLTNTLLKNQLKKRSFTPMATTNQQNVNQIQFQNSTFKESFFNENQNQSGSKNNIKKITRNQKNFSLNSQQEKDQLNNTQQGIVMQQIASQYQYLQLNPQQQQQASPQTFPNLQKQQIKRNEIALSNNQQNTQSQQQTQQLPIQRPSSRSVISQNNGAQQTIQKQKQILNLNINNVGNVSNSNNNNNLNTNQINLYNKVNKV
ncbi:hypothetical protein ABPG72_014136 [Tetrahymena utriculariae]